MASNPRVRKSFHAMRVIGIPEEKVKPVLKDLLKLYDRNWELIEEENYGALADAILERVEIEVATEKNKKLVNSKEDEYLGREIPLPNEPDHPLKRLRLNQDNHVSSSVTNCIPGLSVGELKKPKVEADELNAQEITNPKPQAVPLQPLVRDKGKQPVSIECRPSFNYIPENVIFQKAHVNISLAHIRESCCSKCSGDCLSLSTPCACSNETNGEYAAHRKALLERSF